MRLQEKLSYLAEEVPGLGSKCWVEPEPVLALDPPVKQDPAYRGGLRWALIFTAETQLTFAFLVCGF